MVFLDVILPGMDGLETLKKIRETVPRIKVLMMSGQADLSMAVRATKLGAHNFFEKPLNPDQVLLTLKHLQEQRNLEKRVAALENLVGKEGEMIGESGPMRRLKESILKAAPTEGRVLIYGENGTGKELVARSIHRFSLRNQSSFISLNCAALPKDLVESELFGYEKGAFTGAVRRKSGRFEEAEGGTLFLDEVGDMGLDTQAKLLRVLEENEAIRVGGETPYRFDVRIIAATNKHIEEEIETGRFREDLYYRLNVVPLTVPPLRERLSDIPLLASHFIRLICERMGKAVKHWEGGAIDALARYTWPGNVRELRNFVERLVIMSEADTVGVEDVLTILPRQYELPAAQTQEVEETTLSLKQKLTRYEEEILRRGYAAVEGNVSQLARNLKIDRANLHRKLKSYGIK